MATEPLLFSGSANPPLARLIAAELKLPLGQAEVARFPDGETAVNLLQPVRNRSVFLIQPTAPPVNDHLVELLCFADACRRAACLEMTAVIPYFGYARSDKREARRGAIGASMVAGLLQAVGIEHVITLDLHAAQIEGFFQIPVDCLSATPVFCAALAGTISGEAVVVSPDAGRVKVTTDYGHRLKLPVVVLHKQRTSATETAVTHVVGNVTGRACIIIDDMISTGVTIARAVDALLKAGARPEMCIVATHGPLLPSAADALKHPAIHRILVTDSIAHSPMDVPGLEVLSVAPLLARAIQRAGANGSMSDLY